MTSKPGPPAPKRFPGFAVICLCVVLPLVAVLIFIKSRGSTDAFTQAMSRGKNYADQGQWPAAVEQFRKAALLEPTHPDVHLNLAIAALVQGQNDEAIRHGQEVLASDPSSAPAHYVIGCAQLNLRKAREAVQSLQIARDIDTSVAAVHFQLGRAHQELSQWEEAVTEFQDATALEPEHPAAHYALGQALLRAGRKEDAERALEAHQKILANNPNRSPNTNYQLSKYTQVKAPFKLELPPARGIKVEFTDATAEFFPQGAAKYRAPLALVAINQGVHQSLFVREAEGFRLLTNLGQKFQPAETHWPGIPGARYFRALVGDLQTDRFADVIVVGDRGTHVFKFATNGTIYDITASSGLKNVSGDDAVLGDFAFTGKLDLLVNSPEQKGLRLFKNLGNAYFSESTTNAEMFRAAGPAQKIMVEDWNNDDLIDLFIARSNSAPLWIENHRGGTFSVTNSPSDWPAGSILAGGDLNNDLRTDLVVAGGEAIVYYYAGSKQKLSLPVPKGAISGLALIDYNNDGWLDIIGYGDGMQLWRNTGKDFRETTQVAKLDKAVTGRIEELVAADFDNDGDTDFVVSLEQQGLRFLRNDGANKNNQLKIQLVGNRSNPSGLGIRIELSAPGLRLVRTVKSLPIEIGVGRHQKLDSVNARWVGLSLNNIDVEVTPKIPLILLEYQIMDTSCPYLYAWDGKKFRFVSDFLAASPVGLPLNEQRLVEADPDEYLWIGDEKIFQPREGQYVLQLTEELREVLYLDEARLVVVDHPVGTEVLSTDKLLPGKPFPKSELVTVGNRKALRRAERLDGSEVTAALKESDAVFVSPPQLRIPQYRGLAEPHEMILDFGPLEIHQPLVLALTGWLRFGGGIANMAAARNRELPFPFPQLEVETSDGHWFAVEVRVGAPAGKTKTILVDLAGKIPAGARRLRLTTAFEIHWDRAALFERVASDSTKTIALSPASTHLHWRGFGELEDYPWYWPQTPIYDKVQQTPLWKVTPEGWVTRYGRVNELVKEKDNAFAMINGGDELTLGFDAKKLPEKPEGMQRDFFLWSVGWDKDGDPHVRLGTKIDPLPYHGMDDQLYGIEPRPTLPNDDWMSRFNTRWVGRHTLKRAAK